MDWLYSLDRAGFWFIHRQLSNPFFDRLLPFLSWNVFFIPMVIAGATLLFWKGGARGRVCVVLLFLVTLLGDGLICNSIKHAFARQRPPLAVADVHPLIGIGGSGSMPSNHAANWFAATTVAFIFFRRSIWLMLPAALAISFTRVYLGVHYPSDVLVGALLGIVYATAIVWALDRAWQIAGTRWFPLWHADLPSLIHLRSQSTGTAFAPNQSTIANPKSQADVQWLRLGYISIGLLLLFRLGYIASGKIELTEDEAYQWMWSKHLALSYYSKPPMIAYAQFLGTHLWGDNEFGVRFFSPIIASLLGVLLLRFFSNELNARAGFWLLLIVTATPLLAVGATLLTIDSLAVLFWTAAMLAGWRAVQQRSTHLWLWTGLWSGLGFLSKYTAVFQLGCWTVFFLIWKPARPQLRQPGPYFGLLLFGVCSIPVMLWNWQHGWITVTHLASRGGLDEAWPHTTRFFRDFMIAEFALLNPIFFVAMLWATIVFWKRQPHDPLLIYLFSMGVPLFLFYAAYSFRARVLANWIAPAILPLFCLMVIFWDRVERVGQRAVRGWLVAGLLIGMAVVIALHDTHLISKIAGRPPPSGRDPLNRVRGWQEAARLTGEARAKLLNEGKPVFVIGDHYGITSLLSFYMPEAKLRVRSDPLVYYESSDVPHNQFFFWPGYNTRKGENAIFVQTSKEPQPVPERIRNEFASVADLGIKEISDRGRVIHRLQLFECRGLR